MTRHHGRLTLHHIDLYRIGSPEEAWDLGLDEQLFDSGVCAIEWADRAEEILPMDALWLEFRYGVGEERREIVLDSESARYDHLLTELRRVARSLEQEGNGSQ
jgi:tRNA threonylcarbamoyladenosine biosynthesis protein TsaE